MKTIAAGLILFVTLLLGGCAGGPKYDEVASSFPPLSPDQGRIFFYRSSNMFGAAIQPAVMLNGEEVGQSVPGGFFFVDRASGNAEVLLSTEVDRKLTFVLEPGQERYVAMSVTLGVIVYRVFPELVSPEVGRAAIRELSYTGGG